MHISVCLSSREHDASCFFSYHDKIYLHAGMARKPGATYKEPDFDPLLAMHRIKKVSNYDFGIIKEDTFRVEMELTGWSTRYVAEKI